MSNYADNYYEELVPERPSMTEQLIEQGITTFFARMRPWNPKRGQPHKNYSLAPLQIRFQAGEFKQVHPKLARYLEKQHPQGDELRPPLFLIVSEEQMNSIHRREVQERRQRRAAEIMGEEYKPQRKRRGLVREQDFEMERMPTVDEINDYGKYDGSDPDEVRDRMVGFESHAKGQFDDLWDELQEEYPASEDDENVELEEIKALERGELVQDVTPISPSEEELEFEEIVETAPEPAPKKRGSKKAAAPNKKATTSTRRKKASAKKSTPKKSTKKTTAKKTAPKKSTSTRKSP